MSILMATCEYKKVHGISIRIDIFPIEGAIRPTPAVLFIHGGCLMAGVRTDQSETMSRFYNSLGYAALSVDYRLAPETKLADIIGDIRDALEWMRSEGAQLFNIDPDRIAVTGSSAGGYLALVTGTFSRKPQAIVTNAGYGDVLGDWYYKPDPFYLRQPLVDKEKAFSYIGDKEVTEGHHGSLYLYCRQQGLWTSLVSGYDPVNERDKIMPFCPALNVTKNYPPTFMFHGDVDTDVPYSQSVQMAEALTGMGVEHKLVTLRNTGHMIYEAPDKDELKKGLEENWLFLKRHLG